LLLGPPGVGKKLGDCAGRARLSARGSVYFTWLDQIIRALATADASCNLASKLKTFTTKSQLL